LEVISLYFESSSLWESRCIELFNGSFGDACLNTNWFLSLEDAWEEVEAWRQEYNQTRPHGALENLAPLEFAEAMGTPGSNK
jgi:putative transposase